MNKLIYLTFLVVAFGSCRKTDVVAPPATTVPATPVPPPAQEVNLNDLIKDSAYALTQDIYLWYNQLPASFSPRQYSDPAGIMTGIRSYSQVPGFSQPVDRFSFAIKQEEWNNASTGNDNDLGFSVLFNTATDLRVKFVEKESAAGRAGIQRGWRLTSINGNTKIDTTASSIQMIINAVFNSNTGIFGFKKPDGSTVNLNLTAIAYDERPVVADQVYSLTNGRKVGYFVFNSFMGDTVHTFSEFGRIFNKFSQNDVNELVVDLRYNGGGYVSLAEKLANFLAPATANGQTMMVQTFNDKNARYNETIKFNKLGNINVNRIFFIVSNNTASASELVINSLKPFVDVRLVGPGSTTHGKPVGFFPIPVGQWFIFPVSFKTVNKNGEGNYYNGFPVNQRTRDGVDANWGDPGEASLAAVLNFIQTGSYQGRSTLSQPNFIEKNDRLSGNEFKGTIDVRGLR